MSNKNSHHKMIIHAISTLIGLTITGTVAAETSMAAMPLPDKNLEKCYGVVKAHLNDCGNQSHGCSGEAKMAGDKNEWVAVPRGLCNKIVGGNLKPADESNA